MSNFSKTYPDFVSIEHHIRRAHAERSLAIATTFANAIVATFRGVGRLFSPAAVRRPVTVTASVPQPAARV